MGQLDLALIGNCQVSAILDKQGSYVWTCLPRLDSDAVFASLLGDENNGVWSCLPDAAPDDYEVRQSYVRNTNVVKTEFILKGGDHYEVLDFAPRFVHRESYYRAPQFIRIIRTIKGNPRVRMVFKPVFEYGRLSPEVSISGDAVVYRSGKERVFLHTDVPWLYVIDGKPFELSGDRYFVMSHGEPFDRPIKFGSEEYLERTISYWRTWVKHCNIPFEFQHAVIRSALALKLHIFEDTGAIIAATTTSLPESPHGGRTWDYRYCWLRDAYFVISVLNQLGHFQEMERFIQYLHNIAATEQGGRLQPVYGIGGERIIQERELPWLKGFRGIGPVRVGNHAYTHDQHDVYGEMVLAVTSLFFDARLDKIDLSRAFENVNQLVEKAIDVFDQPDSGIWEFRSEQRHYLLSKVMCWAAVDRGVKIARQLGRTYPKWEGALSRMRQSIETQGWNDKAGFYVQSYGGVNADASNLLMLAVNYHGGDSERFKRMVEQYRRILMDNGFAFRYRNEDDFGIPQHAFSICTFWMIDALAATGQGDEARRIFDRVLSCSNHLGLLSEDVDPLSGELWGNFPQTYSHVGVINSAFRLSKAWSAAF